MADHLEDRVLDFGLDVLDTEADAIYICTTEPTTYAEATNDPGSAGYALGSKSWAAGGAFGSPGAGSPNGRTVASTAITDGAVSYTGTAAKWAVVDTANSRLLACGSLASSQGVTNGNAFTLGSFSINIPNQ